MQTTELQIRGMMCEACVGHVSRALSGVPNVRRAEVDLSKSSAHVEHDDADVEAMLKAVTEEGYEAQIAAPDL